MADDDRVRIPRAFKSSSPVLDLSGGPSGSVKLPEPLGERKMVFHRSYVEDATLEEAVSTVLRINQAQQERTKKVTRQDLVKKGEASRKAVMMILDLTDEEVDKITRENQLGIIMHYTVRAQAETLNPLLEGEGEI